MLDFHEHTNGKHLAAVKNCRAIWYPRWDADALHLTIYVCQEDSVLYFLDNSGAMQPLHKAYKVVYN